MKRAGIDEPCRTVPFVALSMRMAVDQVVGTLGFEHGATKMSVREGDGAAIHLDPAERVHHAHAQAGRIGTKRPFIIVVAEDDARIEASQLIEDFFSLEVAHMEEERGAVIGKLPNRQARSHRSPVTVGEQTDDHGRRE